MAGFGARHFKGAESGGAEDASATAELPVEDLGDVDAVLDELDAAGSHFSAKPAARGGGAGAASSGSPSETMQYVMAARQGSGRVAPGSKDEQGAAFDVQPVATAPVAPEPVAVGSHRKAAGTRFKQQGASAGSGAAAEPSAKPAGTRFRTSDRQLETGETAQYLQAYAAQRGAQDQDAQGRAQQPAGGAQRSSQQAAVQPPAPAAGESAQQPRRKRRTGLDILSTLLIVVGVVLLVVAGGILGKALLGYYEAATVYDELEQYAVVDEEGDDIPSVDFEALSAINADIVGWIYIPGTQINYPVVQTTDNTTYLTKLFDDSSNTSGTIFLDYEGTAPGMVDQQTTIYGHHMNDGSMFKFIDNTLDQEDFDTVEVVYYITADAVYVLKPLCTTEVDETYLTVRQTNFGTTALLQDYLEEMLEQASAKAEDAEERLSSTEQVLSLVTCAGEVLPRVTRAVMICTIEEIITTE